MVLALLAALPALAADGQVWAMLINGGARPESNYQSHLLHLEGMFDVLRERGLDPDRVVVFSSDGPVTHPDLAVRDATLEPDDADWWRGTRAGRLLPGIELVDTIWDRTPELRAARKPVVAEGFAEAAATLKPGDTLFVYTTDHGTRDGELRLWRQDATVDDVRAWIGGIAPGVRVVVAMSQCYSGAFVDAVLPGPEAAFPDACGVFSVPSDRRAYGCYPEGREKFIGHGFRLIDSLSRQPTLAAGHREVLVTDRTPDVPLRSSDAFLVRRVEAEATRTSKPVEEVADALLAKAWADRTRFEAEMRLLDDIADAFGTFSPRTLAELERSSEALKAAAKTARTYADRWEGAREWAVKEQLRRFEATHPEWTERLDKEAAAALEPAERQASLEELLPVLRRYLADAGVSDRLTTLADKEAEAAALQWRLTSREGAMERMRWLLLRVAGTVLVEGTPDAEVVARLEACESAPLGESPGAVPRDEAPWPDLDADLAALEAITPSWLGVKYTPLGAADLADGTFGPGLQRGAAEVTGVMEGSPADAAGILAGDVLTGPPDDPFDEPQELREWTQTQPMDVAIPIAGVRDRHPIAFELTLRPFPSKLPDLVRPKEGDPAPPVEASFRRLGSTAPVPPLEGKEHLLFWWATWCGPCKLAVPEVLAWSSTTGVPVVAITDEGDAPWKKFAAKWEDPFPELVVSDAERASWAAYGVSATPTFVRVSADGQVLWRQRGYSATRGLEAPDWKWSPGSP